MSKKPDEKLLSRALTEALPPLDPVLITTVAEAFRGLDEEREALRGLAEAKTAGEAFLGHYRRYARIAAKRRAEPPRKAHSRYEKLNSELAEAQSAFARAEVAVAAAVAEREAAGQHRTTLSARRDALHDSPEMRDAKALNQAKLDAERLGTLAADRERDLANAVNTLQRRESQLASARGMAAADADAYRRATDGAARAAASAGLSAGHTEILEVLATDSEPYLAAQRAGDQLVDATHTALTTLAKLLDAADTADRAAQRAHDEMDRITGELQQAVERILEAEQDVTAAGAALVASSPNTFVTHAMCESRTSTRFRQPSMPGSTRSTVRTRPPPRWPRRCDWPPPRSPGNSRVWRRRPRPPQPSATNWSRKSRDWNRAATMRRPRRLPGMKLPAGLGPGRHCGRSSTSPPRYPMSSGQVWRPRCRPRVSSTPGWIRMAPCATVPPTTY